MEALLIQHPQAKVPSKQPLTSPVASSPHLPKFLSTLYCPEGGNDVLQVTI